MRTKNVVMYDFAKEAKIVRVKKQNICFVGHKIIMGGKKIK